MNLYPGMLISQAHIDEIAALESDKKRLDWLERDPDGEIQFSGRCCDASIFRVAVDEAMKEHPE